MNTYRVWFTVNDVGYADVVAESVDEAMELANFLNPEDYHECREGEWTVDEMETLQENIGK